MMWSMRPSILGLLSVMAMSCVASTILLSIFQPSSVCAISRPLKRTVTLALCPSSRKRRTCLSLKSKSCFSVFGPILTSLTRIVVCFLRASFSRRACVYLYLPKSMMRHTGGCASGATSTRSSSCCRAVSSACWMGMTPSCAPSAPTPRPSRTRISSLIRIFFAWLIAALLVVSRRIRRAGQGGPAARSRTAHGETGRARADLAREVREHAVEGDGPEVLPAPVPEADGPVLALPLADDEHVRDLPDLRLADRVAELLMAVVEFRPHARGAELLPDGPPVGGVLLAHRQHARLHGRQPRREHARVVLGEDADEALVGAVDRPVDDHRPLRLAVRVDVLELEALREHREVRLDRRDLPRPPERVLERRLRRVPLGLGAELLLRARRELVRRLEVERLVPLADQREELVDLVLELVGAAVDVRVVLGELADANEARERAPALLAAQSPHLAQAERQVAVGAERAPVHVRRRRA